MSIIFLDLDGPMIPWWGATCPDETGMNGKILSGFPFLSRFHPDAITNLRKIADATGAKVVTNSTHNGGHADFGGPDHIRRLFKANGVDDLLFPNSSNDKDWPSFMTGFKTRVNKDWRARKDRALGIRSWFLHTGYSMAATPFVAIDDSIGDFQKYNSSFPHYPKIPFVVTTTGDILSDSGILIPDPLGVINNSDADDAITILKNHSHYTGKI